MKLTALFIILCLLGSLVESEFLLVETEDKDKTDKGEGEVKWSNEVVVDTPTEINEININKQQTKEAEKDYHLFAHMLGIMFG